MRIITNSAGFCVSIEGLSARAIAELDGVKGNLGKTSILEMIRDPSISRKGWHILEEKEKPTKEEPANAERIPAANKLGIKAPTKGLRNRKPSIIKYYPTDKLESSYHAGDFGKYLNIIKSRPGIEASELADRLGWSRNLVMILAGKARSSGLIHQQKESQAINAKRKEPGNLFIQSLTAGGYGAKMNVWIGNKTNFNFA